MPGRILVADDVAINRITMTVSLSSAHYDVIPATCGQEALHLARTVAPDLALIDMRMPDLDGTEVCRRLRATPETADMPIIIVTAAQETEARRSALEAGADDFLSKPHDDLILLARVRNLLRARETARELALRNGTCRALGFADPPSGFTRPGSIALIGSSTQEAMAWKAALHLLVPDRISVKTRAEVLSPPPGRVPDIYLISADLDRPGAGLRLMSELRSQTETRHGAVILAVPEGARETAAMALDLGANDLVTVPFDAREMALRLRGQLTRKRQADRLRNSVRDGLRMAVTDPLTGLFNRRYALPHLASFAQRAAGSGRSFAVMVLDIDHFKGINDRHGHTAGDRVLESFAQRVRDNLRPTDLIARMGGEEFLIALPETEPDIAVATAERLRRAIQASAFDLPRGKGQAEVTVSIGVAIGHPCKSWRYGPNAEAGVQTLLDRADTALYRAKAEGRNRVALHKPDEIRLNRSI
ncbi:response regulator receiver modulated diguanylate cyclase [Rhodovulum imhoffii]|uniref:diguanylate cyclase n=1 Tax=Rhodovulum imhoffii TaxID=365340 RepID=A0A2T5BR01_9RHOB|nr:diguanylate cyclase [Rhodovulum imhoffii]MBK5932573.1 hypothetical protein [Rhodovulum imhoffii]PTN01644.1 response regulator receiver modulated diguanylate cyclase [Rhodovulum imhoffii]